MKNVLYIGNNLNSGKNNVSSIGTLGPMLETEGFQLKYASSKLNKIRRLVDMLWMCIRYRKKVDFVLIDTYSTTNFYYALLVSQLCRVLKLKYIPSLNGGNLSRRLRHYPKLSHLIFNHAYALVSPSLFLKQAFNEQGYLEVVYIPNSLKLNQYPFQPKTHPPIKLLWVRSFSNIYNPTLAIKILKQLGDEGLNAHLCMVGPDTGDGSFQETQQMAKTLDVDVTFTGKLSKQAWIDLAADYTIFINTTNFDNMPVSVIEAMALGLPVVSTDVGGMPYLISHEKDGLLVPANDVNAFVWAIQRLVAHPVATQSMAFNARLKVEQFDWSVVKYRWFEVLK